MAVCTGCSLLCDDIEVLIKDGRISKTKNLCRKGLGRFSSIYTQRAAPKIKGSEVSLKEAAAKAAEILGEAKKPILFGWSNSTLEAQRLGIDLARDLHAVIDDTSSICQGPVIEHVLGGTIQTCTLDDVRNYADTIIFWGCDPSSSHPRHMSRFSYYPRGEKLQKGYEEDRTAFVIDVRMSPTAKIAGEGYIRIKPGQDAEIIEGIIAVLDGKIPKVEEKKRIIALASALKKSKFAAVFPGLGFVYSLKDRMDLLVALMARLNQIAPFNLIPMVGHYNMRGFNQTMLDLTGHINRVSFVGDVLSHGPQSSIIGSLKECDAALVVGFDPASALPPKIASHLFAIPTITIDPHHTLTTEISQVVIPSAVSGLEAGGTALRMDGKMIEISPVVQSHAASDAEIITMIREAV